ncbi:NUDIX domain-containing protein [Candidatus Parcubacteria bacterium]|nr:NUDIX domain-containing protein [Candidatus Parcubacteria bacterium]
MNSPNDIEYLDLVDEKDKIIGKEDRDVIYAKGLRNYRVVNIFVFNSDGEVLLPKRDSTRRIFPNCYDFSCGEHVKSGETYEQAARRGLKEELNLTNVELLPVGKLTPKDGVSSFMKVYKLIYGGRISPNKHEGVESINFYPLDKIKSMISKDPKMFKDDIPKVINLLGDSLWTN